MKTKRDGTFKEQKEKRGADRDNYIFPFKKNQIEKKNRQKKQRIGEGKGRKRNAERRTTPCDRWRFKKIEKTVDGQACTKETERKQAFP